MWILVLEYHHMGSNAMKKTIHNKSLCACHEFWFGFLCTHTHTIPFLFRCAWNILWISYYWANYRDWILCVIFDHYCWALLLFVCVINFSNMIKMHSFFFSLLCPLYRISLSTQDNRNSVQKKLIEILRIIIAGCFLGMFEEFSYGNFRENS